VIRRGYYNAVVGNYIGTYPSGMQALPNRVGVLIEDGDFNTIGGTTPPSRNIVSGNSQAGVNIRRGVYNVVEGNYIGTDSSGRQKLGNNIGVLIEEGAGDNTIGGLTGNVISGNSLSGVQIRGASTSGVLVVGNYIGPDFT